MKRSSRLDTQSLMTCWDVEPINEQMISWSEVSEWVRVRDSNARFISSCVHSIEAFHLANMAPQPRSCAAALIAMYCS